MKSLFINTSTRNTVVSIIVNNEIKYLYKNDTIKDLVIDLMQIIDAAFQNAKMKPNDIDAIFVTNGPGSFTGIRIGLAVVKTMAWSLKIKVIPISSLEFLASTQTNKEYTVSLIDARKGYVFAGVYDNKLNLIFGDSYMLLDDLKQKLGGKEVSYVSNDKFDFKVNEPNYDILKIINKHKNDFGINPHKLNPNYLKNTEAEEKFNEGR